MTPGAKPRDLDGPLRAIARPLRAIARPLRAAALPLVATALVSGVLGVQVANGGGDFGPTRSANPCVQRKVTSASSAA